MYYYSKVFLSALVLGLANAAPSVDLDSKDAVTAAAKKMAEVMNKYYVDGKVVPKSGDGPEGFQWFEMGLYFGAMLEYAKVTGDNSYSTSVVNGLTRESSYRTGSFLGTDQATAALGGKWNDDILWFSFAALTGAELYGKDTLMPGGVTYSKLAANTYKEVIVDTSDVCGGGLYWIRSTQRQGRNKDGQLFSYKSSITNAEAIAHAARLGKLLGNQEYYQEADKLYKWMVSSQLVSTGGEVFDGIGFEDDTCKISKSQFSYQSGMLGGALAHLSDSSGNPEYLTAAHNIFNNGLKTFVENGIIFDQCEKQGNCAENAAHPKGTYVRGLGELHEYTTSSDVRAQIKKALQGSMEAMLKTCDDNFNCGSEWITQAPPKLGYNIHYQMNSMELVTSYLKTFTAGAIPVNNQLSAPTTTTDKGGQKPPDFNPNSALGANPISMGAVLGCFLMLFF